MPKLHAEYFRCCGLRVSDKSFAYLLALALAFSDGWASLLPALSGVLFGGLYATPLLPLGRMRCPRVARSLCRRFVLPFIEAPPAVAGDDAAGVAAAAAAAAASALGGGGEVGGAQLRAGAVRRGSSGMTPRVDPASVERLVAMGFDSAAVQNALAAARGDEDAAVAALVDAQ